MFSSFNRVILAIVVPLSMSNSLLADQTSRGQVLHAEHCTRCHQTEIYNRDNRIVNDLEQLKTRIGLCEQANDLLWFEEEVDAVSAYLNNEFYLFGLK